MSRIIAIDPGLDIAGAAVFDHEAFRSSKQDTDWAKAVSALIGWREIETDSAEKLPDRLHSLSLQSAQLVRDYGAELVYIEEPAFAGGYEHDERRREAVNKLYRAIGAIIAGAHRLLPNGRIVEVRCGREPKAARHKTVQLAATRAKVVLPRGPRDGQMRDVFCAIYLGCLALTTRAERELKACAMKNLDHSDIRIAD